MFLTNYLAGSIKGHPASSKDLYLKMINIPGWLRNNSKSVQIDLILRSFVT